MNNNKPIAIVLGGIFPHAEVIKKLKKRGYYTVLVDYFDNPPAAVEADEHIKESNMDYEVVLKIAREKNAELVLSPCLDQQMVIAMKVAECLNLSHPFSSIVAQNVTNKKYMKKIMMESNIPTAKYYQVRQDSDLTGMQLQYPVMVKPTDSCGAAGVCKIYDEAELEEAIAQSCKWSQSKEAIVEEFKSGVEISVYTFIHNHKATVVTTQQRISVIGKSEVKCFCGLNPCIAPETVLNKFEEIATNIAVAFELNNTPLFFQCIVNEEEVSVIEFAPRLGGGSCYELMHANAKFDMLEAAIDSYLCKEVTPEVQKEEYVYLVHQVYGLEGVFGDITGYQELLEKDIVAKIFFHKMKGMIITKEKASSARVALLLIRADNIWKCLEKLKTAFEYITVVDLEGNDITDRELRLNETVFENSGY